MGVKALQAWRDKAEQSTDPSRDKIVAYCNEKIGAHAARIAGRIDRALAIEARLEALYDRLPARLQW